MRDRPAAVWHAAGVRSSGGTWLPAPEEEGDMSQSNVDGSGGSSGKDGSAIGLGAIASIVGVAMIGIFMAQNREDVTVDFLAWSFTWPLWLLTLTTAVFGALVWFGLGVMRRHRRRKERRQDR
jgi:uncharacterized integral membrane protein